MEMRNSNLKKTKAPQTNKNTTTAFKVYSLPAVEQRVLIWLKDNTIQTSGREHFLSKLHI